MTTPLRADLAGLEDVLDAGVGYGEAVHQLLHAVRTQLGMDVAWTSEFVGDEQVFRFVDAAVGCAAPAAGAALPLSGSYCGHVLSGGVPPLIPDSRQEPAAALLDVTRDLQIGAYVGVPLLSPDGTVTGMLCATSRSAVPTLAQRDLDTLRLLAQLLHDLQVRALSEVELETRRALLRRDLRQVIAGEGRRAVLQPVVDVTHRRVALVEGLSRFDSLRTPAQWFDAAARAGLSVELELAAARSVLDLLRQGRVPAGAAVAVNLSPETLLQADLDALFAGLPPDRLVVEVTEHQPVVDYSALLAVLRPWRARGLRLAVDDAGAGYASLQHVLRCAPDLVKVDMALVRGVDTDPARRALLRAMVGFARETGSEVVAEGVETASERDTLVGLGVELLQGHLLGRPR